MVLGMARPWKHPKTGVYYLRVRVPRDIVDRVGRAIEKSSLKTKDPSQARLAFTQQFVKTQSRWAEIRKGCQYLDDEQVEAVAGEIYAETLARFGKVRSFAAANVHWMQTQFTCDQGDGTTPGSDSKRQSALEMHRYAVQQKLDEKGLLVAAETMQRLLVAVNRALKQAAKLYLNQMNGDWRPDHDADRFPKLALATAPSSPLVSVTIEAFWTKVSVGYAVDTARRWRAILDRFVASAGIKDMALATTVHVEAWRDAALAAGKVSARSFAKNDLTAIKTMFNKAVKAKMVAANPAKEVTVEEAGNEVGREMRDLYDEEAVLILKRTLAPPPRRLASHLAAARRWVPWICAYTGARVTEITQARACDIRQIEKYWCIRITPEAGTTKTRRSRFVPLHEHLIEQGFLEFVQRHRRDQRLFASEIDGKKTTAAQVTSGKLSGWVRKVVKDPDVAPNHGWRHRFETEARFHMAEMFIDAIQGHAGKTQGRKYGRFPPRMLGPLIAKMPRQPVEVPSDRRLAGP